MNIPSKSINKAQDNLARDFQNVVSDAEEFMRTVGQDGEAKYGEVSKRVKASIDTAKLRLVEMGETARVRTVDAAKSTDEYVRGNPWQAVGIGAAVGTVIGLLIASRR